MNKGIKRALSAFCIINICFVSQPFNTLAQGPVVPIELKVKKFPFNPKEFYIKKVVDNRKNKESIGSIVTSAGNPLQTRQAVLKGGADIAVFDFISKSLASNSKLRPVILSLNELKVTEKVLPGGLISGDLDLVVSFELDKDNEPIKLLDHRGGASYTRSANQQDLIESVISASVMNVMGYFNRWIDQEANRNDKLAKGLELTFTEAKNTGITDTLFYDAEDPLNWADFKSKPDARSRFAAEIFPFMAFEESYKVVNGVINIDIKLKIYLVRSFSWVKDYARTPHTLNHEQRHFDIVKLAADRFKKRIKDEDLNVDNYQGILSVEYLETLREMNRLQVQYDTETSHGANEAAQKKWDALIDKELRS